MPASPSRPTAAPALGGLALAGAAAWQASHLFAAPPSSSLPTAAAADSSRSLAAAALRGAAAAAPAAAAGSPAPAAAAAAGAAALATAVAAAAGLAGRGLAAGSRGAGKTVVKVSIMQEAEEEPAAGSGAGEEAKAPPPPPPFDPAMQIGVTEPLGFFDPLGFSKVGDEQGFRNLRVAELKHGRVAMMAAAGAVFQYYGRLPIFFDYDEAGLKAAYSGNGKFGMFWLVVICGFLELFVWSDDPKKEPGNFGDPLGFNIYDPDMRNKELNNGRAAMFAALGIVVAELYTGKDAMQQLGFGTSPVGSQM